ncbi:hypothetical protein R1flu_018316 [Riccia fluitans]|uniref:MBD domain-containing protein n=1 Tax=Riccia fluitans TaxID=41844 RepID=A0ABD1ZFH4_9MARC
MCVVVREGGRDFRQFEEACTERLFLLVSAKIEKAEAWTTGSENLLSLERKSWESMAEVLEVRMRDSARSSAAAAPPSTTTSLVKNEQHGEVSYLDFISLPIIRLDEFDQDELRLLAQYSGDFSEAAFENIVIPKIDRRIFNESAGSRRQTYGKCFASRHWNTGSDNADDSEEEDEDSEPARSRSRGRPRKKRKKERKVNVPDKTRSAKAVARVIVERKERLCLRDTTSQGGAEALGSSSVGIRIQNLVSDSSDVSGWINSAEKTVMPTGTGKRGRPRKLGPNGLPINPPRPDTLADYSSKNQKQEIVSLEVEEDFEEGPGRRTRKRRASANYSVASEAVDGRESKRRPERGIILGRNGETDRKDEGVRTYYGEEELMEILRQMEGKWSSAQMKRKFVDAIGFPKGWTVLVGMRHTNDGRAYFDYREWRSPEGRIWTSYKEAAAYLLSTVGKDICIEGGLGPSLAGQEDGCEQNALIDDGENGVDQTLINSSSFAALLNAHDSQLFFETQAEGDLQSLERGLNQDLQDLERGACEARIDHFQTAGDHVDKFLRASCRSDDVAISTQAFGEQMGPIVNQSNHQTSCPVYKRRGCKQWRQSWLQGPFGYELRSNFRCLSQGGRIPCRTVRMLIHITTLLVASVHRNRTC